MTKADADEDSLKALEGAISDMVASEEWQALIKERGWVDMHLSSADFGAFLETEQPNIETILSELGLAN
jgi:putative tricarboxylic transport membrane protein